MVYLAQCVWRYPQSLHLLSGARVIFAGKSVGLALAVIRPAAYTRPKAFSSSVAASWIMVGRPWGQVRGDWHASS